MKKIRLLAVSIAISFFGLHCSEEEYQKKAALQARIKRVMGPLDIRHDRYPENVLPSALYTYCRGHYDDPDCQKAADIIEHIFKTGKFHYLKETRPLTEVVEELKKKHSDITVFDTSINVGVALGELAKEKEAKAVQKEKI